MKTLRRLLPALLILFLLAFAGWWFTRPQPIPVVLHEFREGRAKPLSDHDAIGVDVSP